MKDLAVPRRMAAGFLVLLLAGAAFAYIEPPVEPKAPGEGSGGASYGDGGTGAGGGSSGDGDGDSQDLNGIFEPLMEPGGRFVALFREVQEWLSSGLGGIRDSQFGPDVCKSGDIMYVFLPSNYKPSERVRYFRDVEAAKNFWLKVSPLKECENKADFVEVLALDRNCQPPSYIAPATGQYAGWVYGKCIPGDYKKNSIRQILLYNGANLTCRNGACTRGMVYSNYPTLVMYAARSHVAEGVSHELGHTYGLCDEAYGMCRDKTCESGYKAAWLNRRQVPIVGGKPYECSAIINNQTLSCGDCCPNKALGKCIMNAYYMHDRLAEGKSVKFNWPSYKYLKSAIIVSSFGGVV